MHHDLYDEFDPPVCPNPRLVMLPKTPPWDRRGITMTYADGPGSAFVAWHSYTPGCMGASFITTETGTATWPDGTTSPVTRHVATDTAVEADMSLTVSDMFKRHYIDQRPGQVWKHSTDLVIGDRIMELTDAALGLDPDGLPAVIDMIDNIADPATGQLYYHVLDTSRLRSVHYVAARACNGRTEPQGASHRLVSQWVRLEDKATTT